jgi:hypothetical protein
MAPETSSLTSRENNMLRRKFRLKKEKDVGGSFTRRSLIM